MTRTAWLYSWVAVVAGLAVASTLTLEWAPKVSTGTVVLQATWSGASPAAMAKVGSRIESAILGTSGTGKIRSWARRGNWSALVELPAGSHEGLQQAAIFDRVVMIRESLPRGVTLSVDPQTRDRLGAGALMTLQMAPGQGRHEDSEAVVGLISDRLRALPGVASVQVHGQTERELRVTLGPELAASCASCASTVVQTLQSALRSEVYGSVAAGSRSRLVVRGAVETAQGLKALTAPGPDAISEGSQIGDLENPSSNLRGGAKWRRLGRLVDLGEEEAPRTSLSRIDGKPMVTLSIYRIPGSDLIEVADRVRAEIPILLADFPGLDLRLADDRSEQVQEQLRDLALRGGLGLCLVALVLALMLRSIRATGLCLFSVLLSFSLAFLGFRPLGLTLNMLTLAGLALLVGLLVDNGVVVIERLQATRRSLPGRPAQELGVGLPLLGATLSTCVVLIPTAYLSGELREVFMAFAVLAATVLLLSLVVSLGVMPVLGRHLKLEPSFTLPAGLKLQRAFLAPYHLAARFPKSFIALALLAIGVPVSLIPEEIEQPVEGWRDSEQMEFAQRYNRSFGSEKSQAARAWLVPVLGGVTDRFLREVELGRSWDLPDRPTIRIWLRVPSGSDLERVDALVRPFEETARACDVVKRTLVQVAGREARVAIVLRDEALTTEEPYRLRERLIERATALAGVEISVSGLLPSGFYSGLGEASGYSLTALGPSYEKLASLSEELARRLKRHPRVAHVDTAASPDGEQAVQEVVRVHWGGEAVAQTGVSAKGLASVLGSSLWRMSPDFYAPLGGDSRMPIRVVTEGAETLDLEGLRQRAVAGGITGGLARLADHGEIDLVQDPPVIERLDQQFRRTIRVYYRGTFESGRKQIAQELRNFPLPPGYRIDMPKLTFLDEISVLKVWGLILGAVGLVFLVVAAVLESWRLASVVVLSVPLGWIGIAAAFLMTGQNFAEGALLGVVLVIGISVNDSILLAHRYGVLQQRRPQTERRKLALLAVRHRLKPMWTTTLTTVAGMAPMLVAAGGDPFWRGLAITVVGGLGASTLLGSAAAVAMLTWHIQLPRWDRPRESANRPGWPNAFQPTEPKPAVSQPALSQASLSHASLSQDAWYQAESNG